MQLTRTRQAGLSLVELMVGMLVSLIVLGAASSMYLTTVRGQTYSLRTAKLNQELRATLNVLAADLRRAGYWGGAVTAAGGAVGGLSADPAGGGTSYPYSRRGAAASQTDLTVLNGGACLLYAYDLNSAAAGVVPAVHVFGFRLNGNQIEMLNPADPGVAVTSNCAGNWIPVTSGDIVAISALNFSTTGSQCLNVTKGLSWRLTQSPSTQSACAASGGAIAMNDGGTYAAPTSGDLMIETRQVVVTLTGSHAADATMIATVSETVHVQNDRIFTVP